MKKYELLIEQLMDFGYGSIEGLFDLDLLSKMKEDLLDKYEDGILKPAGIGKKFDYQKNLEVRGDKILWLEGQNPLHQQYFNQVNDFMQYMNRTCFTALNAHEFHYAVYKPGSFYKRHIDQFKGDRGRLYSVVTYLNDDWSANDGGEIALYLDGEREELLLPNFGLSVFFKSDELEHEVKTSQKQRLSIAGWLKSV
jgi:SM-20-related protein